MPDDWQLSPCLLYAYGKFWTLEWLVDSNQKRNYFFWLHTWSSLIYDNVGLYILTNILFACFSGIQDLRFPAYKVKPAYVRIYNDSLLKYSARVNYDVACPMHFEKYPVDIQRCNVSFESWGHTNHYIMLSWLTEKRKFSSSIALAQFDLDLHFIEEPPSAFGTLGKKKK